MTPKKITREGGEGCNSTSLTSSTSSRRRKRKREHGYYRTDAAVYASKGTRYQPNPIGGMVLVSPSVRSCAFSGTNYVNVQRGKARGEERASIYSCRPHPHPPRRSNIIEQPSRLKRWILALPKTPGSLTTFASLFPRFLKHQFRWRASEGCTPEPSASARYPVRKDQQQPTCRSRSPARPRRRPRRLRPPPPLCRCT